MVDLSERFEDQELGDRFEEQRRQTAVDKAATFLAHTHPTFAEVEAERYMLPSAD
jgi:hypothetical protein